MVLKKEVLSVLAASQIYWCQVWEACLIEKVMKYPPLFPHLTSSIALLPFHCILLTLRSRNNSEL